MVAGLMALGIMYGTSLVVRQSPKVFGLMTGALLLKAKRENENLQRLARLGFDVVRDVQDADFGRRTFHVVRFPRSKKNLHRRLQFLRGKKLVLTSEEAFLLSKAIKAVEDGEAVVPVDFKKLIEISEARLNDEALRGAFSSKTT
jgi:hypothetical protein